MPLSSVHLSPLQDSAANKSLTPQRKHRKLLKDGSGAEVWPESIERIFVQGLREYWSSPYATYPQSRGRSRWRNQFLVDYLQKHSITRSKKQVASHIQVLRNMWKGEPEYQLVAGGEELADISPPAGSTIKLEDHQWASGLIPLELDDPDGYSSTSASPDFSPPDFQNQVLSASPYAASFPNSAQDYPCFSGYSHLSPVRGLSIDTTASGYSKPQHSLNRIHALRLMADGMSPFTIRTDGLIPVNQPYQPLQLKIRLSISTMQDSQCPPGLTGFAGSIWLSHIWTSGKCITKTIVGSNVASENVDSLEVSEISAGTVNAALPESSLSSCRWLDFRSPTTITQEIIIDDVSLMFVIYELDRISGNPMPSAQFTGYLKYPSSRNSLSSNSPGNLTSSRPYSSAASNPTCNSASADPRGISASPSNSSLGLVVGTHSLLPPTNSSRYSSW